jgi:RimJ/RimL family protein N-acetyltransferase
VAVAPWYSGRHTVKQAEDWAAGAARAWERDAVNKWMAYDRTTGALVGRGGLSRARLNGQDCLEVGWTVRGDLWGRGYATEIGAAGLRFAFEDLGAAEVISFTDTANRRARAVMERLGMRHTDDIEWDGDPFVLYRTVSSPAA